ncbi:E3 ubiquitin-protein ligase cblA-like, partial [Ruditapes philippinarum]|uniref:E3 ubiquitin-protein ligase cblA-like n=1 Tax=Ruditapes philippinarum TaxID=129788 RepID=UPI00295B2E05
IIITSLIGIFALLRLFVAARLFWNGDNQERIRQETGYNGNIERDRNPYDQNNSDAEGRVVSLRRENHARERVVSLRHENRNRRVRRNRHSAVLLQNQVTALPHALREQLPDELMCSECTTNIRDAVNRECGHIIICQRCLVRFALCPRCGRRIRTWSEVSWF